MEDYSLLGDCPSCGCQSLKRHAHYTKYHFNNQIFILRVRCENCGITHAIIPSFSIPGTSLGTEEVEKYLINRELKLSRIDALSGLFFTNDIQKTGRKLEDMFERIINRSKVLLNVKTDHRLTNLEWIESICGKSKAPLTSLNLYGLSKGINGIAFNRINILLFKNNNMGLPFSLNMGTSIRKTLELDSA